MKHLLATLAAIVALTLTAQFALVQTSNSAAYTARQIQAGILAHPDRWLGHAILLRGSIVSEGRLYAAGTTVTRYAIGTPGARPALAWSMQAAPADFSTPAPVDPRSPLVVDQMKGTGGWLPATGRGQAIYEIALAAAPRLPGCTVAVCYHAYILGSAPRR